METTSVCGCCLQINRHKDLRTLYTRPGLGASETEVYAIMLAECFDIHVTLENDDECGICEVCVGRLRDASDFKLQVQRSQAELRERLGRVQQVKDEDAPVFLGADDGALPEEYGNILDEECLVKSEAVDAEDVSIDETGYFDSESPVKSEPPDGAASDEDSATPGCVGTFGSGALSARARQQLAMTCVVRLERLRQCPICHSLFDQESTLTSHMKDMHTDSFGVRAEETCTCDTCGEQFTNKMYLTDHIQKHMETFRSCKICSKSFASKFHFAKHSRIHEKPKAGSELVTLSNLNKQGVIQAEREPYSYDMCHKSFKLKSHSRNHLNIHTGQKPYKCEICNKQFIKKGHVKRHIRIHTGQKPHKCEICNKQFTQKGDLNRHMYSTQHTRRKAGSELVTLSNLNKQGVIQAEREPYSCDMCHKSFKVKSRLRNHLNIHTGQKPYKCEICNKQFTQKGHLKRHIRIHTGQKDYKCKICKKRFTQKGNFTTHMIIHTGQKPFKCETCNKRFNSKANLDKHIRIHTELKPYKCEICNKRFNFKANLDTHIRIHTGQKPYKCEICNKQFTQNGALTRHMLTHTGQKPFKCEICNKGFNQKPYLNKHMRVHTGQKP